ncbi:vegetative incompatibility protein HET-E-1 [Dorcoceras hygrometricum]|uniref:Vegetative incompatibility protein HET-E-1 n=1 Tax=Dorcoceras hygrometricum TaxID=472368 RepID=A0A2Z7D0Z1_9LAMI|nr:vegetative incompatibility protein HET-E-1 [Dorcoceras hygrometricum]
MVRFLLPFQSDNKGRESEEILQSNDSFSNSSLASQSSLQSVPSLSAPCCSDIFEQQPAAAASHQCLVTLKGHSSYVFSLTLAGKYLYSADSNGEIRVWDRIKYSSAIHDSCDGYTVAEGCGAVKFMLVLGEKLFTAHQDNKIRVWKVDSSFPTQKYKINATLPTMNDRCSKIFSAGNYVKVRKNKKCTWVHHVDAVSALSLSKDGSLLYSVSWDRTLKLWRTSDFRCLESVQNAHDDAINAVVSSVDGHIYTGSADKKIKVWRKNEGDQKHSLVSTLEKHKSAVNALALSTDGSVLYSGACDRSIIVWDKDGGAAHMAVTGALRGHTKAILCLTVVADMLCSGSADRTVRVWRRGAGKSYCCLAVLEGHKSPIKCLTAASDDNISNDNSGKSYLVYSGSLDFDVKTWQIWVPSF